MSIGVPTRLANGIGNWPDAAKWMDDYDYLTALIFGNFSLNGGMELWNAATTFSNPANLASVSDSWIVGKSGTSSPTVDVSREATIIDSGVYSMKLNITGAGSANSIFNIHQSLATPTRFASETILLGVRCRASTANKLRCKIYDGVNSSFSTYHTGGSTFELLTATLGVSSTPSEITLTVEVNPSDFTGALYIDSIFLFVVPSAISSTAKNALAYTPLNAGFLPLTGGILTGALQMADGTVSLPGLSFSSDTDCGLYRIGTNDIALATNGAKALEINATQQVGITDGAVGAPGLCFWADTDTGFYRIGANNFGLVIGGTKTMDLGVNTQVTSGCFQVANGSAAAPSLSFVNDSDTGFYWDTNNNVISVAVGGVRKWQFNGSLLAVDGANTSGTIGNASGTAGAPSYSFNVSGLTSTGIYGNGSNTMAFSAAGVLQMQMDNTEIAIYCHIRPPSDNTWGCGGSSKRWSAVWAANGTIQTSVGKSKENIADIPDEHIVIPRGITFSRKKYLAVPDADVDGLAGAVQEVAVYDEKGMPTFQKKFMASGETMRVESANLEGPMIGFLADDLPENCFAIDENGNRSKEDVYTSSVIGILCSAVTKLTARIETLEASR